MNPLNYSIVSLSQLKIFVRITFKGGELSYFRSLFLIYFVYFQFPQEKVNILDWHSPHSLEDGLVFEDLWKEVMTLHPYSPLYYLLEAYWT
jgi:hypothetical protein